MAYETKWSLDPDHSEISFKLKHLMFANVKGSFTNFGGSIYTTKKDFSSAVIHLWIDVSSLSSGDELRDEYLMGSNLFDIENQKEITFTSIGMGPADKHGKFELLGKLTIKGITKKIKLNVQFGGMQNDELGNEKVMFKASGQINRSQYGLVCNSAIEVQDLMLSDEVSVWCEIELVNDSKKNQDTEWMPLGSEMVAL